MKYSENCPHCNSKISNNLNMKWFYKCDSNCPIIYSRSYDEKENKYSDEQCIIKIDHVKYTIRNVCEYNTIGLLIFNINESIVFKDLNYHLNFSQSKEQLIEQVKLLLTFQ